jgi:hypothetical protein
MHASMNKRLMLALLGGLTLAGGGALAQNAPAAAPGSSPGVGPARLRGTVDAVTETGLDMTTRAGMKLHVTLPAQFRVTQVISAKLADIQPGSYIGSAAAPQPDGSLRALQVSVFPPAMRGVGEGHYAWDLTPGSTMTNGTVGNLVGTSGRTMTVTYNGGERQIVIPDDVPVVSFEPGDRSLLKPGAKVIVNGPRAADGSVTAASISVGKDGLVPPM